VDIFVIGHICLQALSNCFENSVEKKPDTTNLRRPVRHGVSQGVEDDRRPPALQAGHSRNSCKVHLQGVQGSGMVGSVETLGSLWIPLFIRA
jgi:hypothetical protein